MCYEMGKLIGRAIDSKRSKRVDPTNSTNLIFAGFRCRGALFDAFFLSFEQVDDLIASAKLSVGVLFQMEREKRRSRI